MNGEYKVDFQGDSYSDLVRIAKPRGRSPRHDTDIRVFRAFVCEKNPEVKNFKAEMKDLTGRISADDWEGLLNAGVKRLSEAEDLTQFKLVVTPASSGYLANNIATSLEEYIDRRRIVRDGIVKAAI